MLLFIDVDVAIQLHNLYGNADIIRTLKSRRLRWTWHVACMGDTRRAHKILLGNPEGTRPRGKPKIRWENNIIRDLKEVDYEGVHRCGLEVAFALPTQRARFDSRSGQFPG